MEYCFNLKDINVSILSTIKLLVILMLNLYKSIFNLYNSQTMFT